MSANILVGWAPRSVAASMISSSISEMDMYDWEHHGREGGADKTEMHGEFRIEQPVQWLVNDPEVQQHSIRPARCCPEWNAR